MTVGSLFAGIGGLELGLERAGMEVRWQVEKDGFCRRVLARHWPDVKRYEDVRDVGAHNLEKVDLICGGFPCQPVSKAGGASKRGVDDERWMWPEFARIIREMGPRYALLENVPAILVREAGGVLGDLAEIGYDAEWACLSAGNVGAPHGRDRWFAVAYPHSRGRGQKGKRSSMAGVFGGTAIYPGATTQSGGLQGRDKWLLEPKVGRVADGLPSGLDKNRIKALGNAVVPQVAEWIGRRIVEAHEYHGERA